MVILRGSMTPVLFEFPREMGGVFVAKKRCRLRDVATIP